MAIGIEYRGESYGLLIDAIGEVLNLPASGRQDNPVNLEPLLARVLAGVHRLEDRLLVVLDIERVLDVGQQRKRHEFAPKVSDQPKQWAGSPATQSEAAMKTCLVADDSSVIRKVARRILEKLDFQIVEAEDGEQALEACRSAMPDAVLLDWNMPKMDGYEFLRNLRRLPDGDRPKVVFCTTENDVAHIARALHAGANEYIMKPFDKEIVEAKFQEVGLI
jgi:two-component system, chemotaxis family, chemotaxis protein CheY